MTGNTDALGSRLSAGPSSTGGPANINLAPRQHGPAGPERGDMLGNDSGDKLADGFFPSVHEVIYGD